MVIEDDIKAVFRLGAMKIERNPTISCALKWRVLAWDTVGHC